MKKPDPINFEYDSEYEDYCKNYDRYLRHEEWTRKGAKRAFNTWIIVLGSLMGLAVGFLAAYKLVTS